MLKDFERSLWTQYKTINGALKLPACSLIGATHFGGAHERNDVTLEVTLVIELCPAARLLCLVENLNWNKHDNWFRLVVARR